MTDEDAIHFHRLCELRGELVRTKKELEDTRQELVIHRLSDEDKDAAGCAIALLQTELNEAKAECKSLRQKLVDAEINANWERGQKNTLFDINTALKSERDNLQTTANVLEADCDKYRQEIARLKFHNENLEAAVKATKLDRELYLALELKDDLHQGELAQAFDELDKMKQEVAKLLDVPERYMTDQKEYNRSSIV